MWADDFPFLKYNLLLSLYHSVRTVQNQRNLRIMKIGHFSLSSKRLKQKFSDKLNDVDYPHNSCHHEKNVSYVCVVGIFVLLASPIFITAFKKNQHRNDKTNNKRNHISLLLFNFTIIILQYLCFPQKKSIMRIFLRALFFNFSSRFHSILCNLFS